MITLRKKEQIEIYQVELTLKEKTKQSPFIAILILAKELWENDEDFIDAEALQGKLLTALPIRACQNLLERLTDQGYFEDIWEDDDFYGYKLTELGDQSAIDKSFWVGKKGVFNVYVNTNLIDSGITNNHIVRIEETKNLEDDKNKTSYRSQTPQEISAYKGIQIKLNNQELLLEEIEDNCFQLQPLNCSLEIEANADEALIKIVNDKQPLFQSSFDINENGLKEKLLSNTNEFDYDESKKVVLSEFDQDNLSFNRKIKLRNPYFRDNEFNSVEIENVGFIPSDERNAELWLNELLFQGIDKYFLDEKIFNEFASNKAKPILEHYNVALPTREQLKQNLAEKENAFYQTAKLETIDYLNF
jgi:hypothetical protein